MWSPWCPTIIKHWINHRFAHSPEATKILQLDDSILKELQYKTRSDERNKYVCHMPLTLPKTNLALARRPSQKETHLPTTVFQALYYFQEVYLNGWFLFFFYCSTINPHYEAPHHLPEFISYACPFNNEFKSYPRRTHTEGLLMGCIPFNCFQKHQIFPFSWRKPRSCSRSFWIFHGIYIYIYINTYHHRTPAQRSNAAQMQRGRRLPSPNLRSSSEECRRR